LGDWGIGVKIFNPPIPESHNPFLSWIHNRCVLWNSSIGCDRKDHRCVNENSSLPGGMAFRKSFIKDVLLLSCATQDSSSNANENKVYSVKSIASPHGALIFSLRKECWSG